MNQSSFFKLIRKCILAVGLVGGVVCAAVAFKGEGSSGRPELTIALTQVIDHPALNATKRGILDELESEGYAPGTNCRIVFESAQGDVVTANQIAQKFVGMKPNVIIAIGTTSAQAVKAAARGTQIPIVFSSITDPVGSRLVGDLKQPKGNVTGLSNWMDIQPQFKAFRKMLPDLTTLGVVYNPGETNSVSLLKTVREAGEAMGISIITAPAEKSAEVGQAALSIVNDVDAIFITNDNTALSAFESIVKVCNDADTPVFVSDTDMVERGAVAAFGPNQYQLGRQTGQVVVRILRGEKPADIAIQFPRKSEFHINLDAMAGIRLNVSNDTIESADRVCRMPGLLGYKR